MNKMGGCTSQRFVRLVLGGLLLAAFIRLCISPAMIQSAQAQIPDAGSQRLELIREVQRTNELLEKLLQVLAKDSLKVNVQNFEDLSATLSGNERRPQN